VLPVQGSRADYKSNQGMQEANESVFKAQRSSSEYDGIYDHKDSCPSSSTDADLLQSTLIRLIKTEHDRQWRRTVAQYTPHNPRPLCCAQPGGREQASSRQLSFARGRKT